MKISILSNNLSENGVYRIFNIAKVLQREYEVEIIGPVFGQSINNLLNPQEFSIKSVRGCNFPAFFSSITEILNNISGDVIYAHHPILTSFGLGLLKKLSSKIPVIVDVDDWPVGHWLVDDNYNLRRSLSRIRSLFRIRNPNCHLYSLVISKFFATFANNITITNKFLQKKFGGIILPQSQDTQLFDPSRYDREKLRRKWGISNIKIIMFLGTPNPYKGVEDIIHALNLIKSENIKLMLVGIRKRTPYVKNLLNIGKGKIVLVDEFCPIQEVPAFLSMADLIVIPQKHTPITQAQTPAKLIDAMAMAKPIIATNVADIADILDNCGIIIEPGNIQILAEKISYLIENESEAKTLGLNARIKCQQEFSFDSMEKVLSRIFDNYN